MAKHKHPRLRFLERINQPPPPPAPEQVGLRAFSSGDLQGAISTWSSIAKPREAVTVALAEAYLRRALIARDPAARRADLAPSLAAVLDGRLVLAGGLFILLTGLWWVQVVSAREYQSHLDTQAYRTIRIPAVRGKILDPCWRWPCCARNPRPTSLPCPAAHLRFIAGFCLSRPCCRAVCPTWGRAPCLIVSGMAWA